jgi:hypothetical protein
VTTSMVLKPSSRWRYGRSSVRRAYSSKGKVRSRTASPSFAALACALRSPSRS